MFIRVIYVYRKKYSLSLFSDFDQLITHLKAGVYHEETAQIVNFLKTVDSQLDLALFEGQVTDKFDFRVHVV